MSIDSSIKKTLNTSQIQKEVMYWNINALNNVAQFSSLIQRNQTNKKPKPRDLQLRDFYFARKLTLQDGKFQPESFIQKSIQYIGNFRAFDKSGYLQSINFDNNLKKYRFWKNLLYELPKDKETNEIKQNINRILWAYRFPVFLLFSSFMYIVMIGIGFTKIKKMKQFAMFVGTLYVADVFVQRRKSNDIFYEINQLQVKYLQKKRKQIINQSVILDGQIYQLDKGKSIQSQQLIDQSKYEEDQVLKKALLEAAGFDVIETKDKVI